jgi:hypothetical protein
MEHPMAKNKKKTQKRDREEPSSGASGFDAEPLAESVDVQANDAQRPRVPSPLKARPNKRGMTIRFDPDLLDRFDAAARRAGVSRASLLNVLIHNYLRDDLGSNEQRGTDPSCFEGRPS